MNAQSAAAALAALAELPVYLPGGGCLQSIDSDSSAVYLRGDEEAIGSPDERESLEELIGKGIDPATAADLVAGGYRKGVDNTEAVVVAGMVLTPGTGAFEAEGQAF